MVNVKHSLIKFATIWTVFGFVFSANTVQADNLSVVVSTGSPIFASSLLDKTARDFLGRPSATADFDLDANRVAFAGRALTLRWTNRKSIAPRWNHVSAVSAGFSRYSDTQADGISIFVDPAKIKVRSVVFEGQTGLEYERKLAPKLTARLSGSVGVQASYSKISITSAVLNVRNDLTALNPFAEIKTSVEFGNATPVEGYLSIRAAPRGYQELAIGIATHF